jgi:hypothetical protein
MNGGGSEILHCARHVAAAPAQALLRAEGLQVGERRRLCMGTGVGTSSPLWPNPTGYERIDFYDADSVF